MFFTVAVVTPETSSESLWITMRTISMPYRWKVGTRWKIYHTHPNPRLSCPKTNTHTRARAHKHTRMNSCTQAPALENMHARIHTHTHTCKHARARTHTHAYTHTHTHTRTHARTHARTHTHALIHDRHTRNPTSLKTSIISFYPAHPANDTRTHSKTKRKTNKKQKQKTATQNTVSL